MAKLPPDLEYVIAITTPESFDGILNMVKKRFENLDLKFESKQLANSFAKESCFFIQQKHDTPIPSDGPQYLRETFDLDNPYDSPAVIFSLVNFIKGFLENNEVDDLEIIVGSNEIESFRLASFIGSYCKKNNKNLVIKDTDLKQISELYGPHVQDTSLSVLYSIIHFRIKYGKFPNFEKIKNHHFEITRELYKEEEFTDESKAKSNRKWGSSDDNKFVASLYASQRNLNKQGLLFVKKDDLTRTITDLIPTKNGFLSVIFSDLGNLLLEYLEMSGAED